MRACEDAALQFRVSRVRVRVSVRDKVGVELVMVLGLAHFTFCHTSSPHPRRPSFYLT